MDREWLTCAWLENVDWVLRLSVEWHCGSKKNIFASEIHAGVFTVRKEVDNTHREDQERVSSSQ
jgi:hypothetical protein